LIAGAKVNHPVRMGILLIVEQSLAVDKTLGVIGDRLPFNQ
jgi:hypothetical protein